MTGLVPQAGASARFGAGFPFFDFDQFNYIVGLKRAYSDISYQDLVKSFNRRYNRKASWQELRLWFDKQEAAAKGEVYGLRCVD